MMWPVPVCTGKANLMYHNSTSSMLQHLKRNLKRELYFSKRSRRIYEEIDDYIAQAKDRSYETMMRFGKRGLNLAANAAVTAAAKGQGVLSDKLRSFSMQDLTLIQTEEDLALHPSERGRSRRDTVDDMGSGASTLPRARSASARQTRSLGTLNDDASSQHSSDMSDTRTEHSDDDLGERTTKKGSTAVKTTKKPTATKTETQAKTVKKSTAKKKSAAAETP